VLNVEMAQHSQFDTAQNTILSPTALLKYVAASAEKKASEAKKDPMGITSLTWSGTAFFDPKLLDAIEKMDVFTDKAGGVGWFAQAEILLRIMPSEEEVDYYGQMLQNRVESLGYECECRQRVYEDMSTTTRLAYRKGGVVRTASLQFYHTGKVHIHVKRTV
jgi:hypothetical protein